MSNVVADHAAAILALLNGNPALAGRVFDGKVPDPTPAPPYVLVYMHLERPTGAAGNSMDGLSREATLRIICHCAGQDATGARAMSYQVSAALLDVRPVVGSRSCGLIRQEESPPPRSDELTGGQVMDQVDVYRLTTQP